LVPNETHDEKPDDVDDAEPLGRSLRELARAGLLTAADHADPTLRRAALDVVWPLVWHRHTRWLEVRKGHPGCATGLHRMSEPCLDGFHDDVESVVDYLFAHAKTPIRNLEGWIASRITVATVEGYRKRRGERGALQRIRVPRWLAAALAEDRWLVELAGGIIEWVGVPGTAGTSLWPLDAWTERRSRLTGERGGPGQVAAEVERVLAAMRQTRPTWHATYIERPLERKQLPISAHAGADREAPDAVLVRAVRADANLITLAAVATDAISAAIADGEEPDTVIPRVLRAVFLAGETAISIDALPGEDDAAYRERLAAVLADQASVARLVDAVRSVVGSSQPGRSRG
jgi:hypothetical protein